jgi:hypothetical protein
LGPQSRWARPPVSFRTKDGVGLNLKQQIASDVGVFARASYRRARWKRSTQGTVEGVDFTDINESISGGALLTGSRWARTVEFGRVPPPTEFRIRASSISPPAIRAGS